MINQTSMQTGLSVRESAPIRLLSAALCRVAGARPCSYCAKRVVGLPYPEADARLHFCNSKCSVMYHRKHRKA